MAAVLPLVGTVLGAAVYRQSSGIAAFTGLGVSGLSLLILVAVLLAVRQPRLAYEDGFLLVHLSAGRPIRLPVDVVECFFLARGPSHLPHAGTVQTANIVVRLAESAHAWKQQQVSSRLGAWSDGYITIRGAWTEPIDGELAARLNENLRLVQHARRAQESTTG